MMIILIIIIVNGIFSSSIIHQACFVVVIKYSRSVFFCIFCFTIVISTYSNTQFTHIHSHISGFIKAAVRRCSVEHRGVFQQRCFPANFVKFLITPIQQNICRLLLLDLSLIKTLLKSQVIKISGILTTYCSIYVSPQDSTDVVICSIKRSDRRQKKPFTGVL